MSLCGASKLGTGSVLVNGGALTGKVTAYNGVPSGGGSRRSVSTPTCSSSSGAYSFSTTGIGTLDPKTNTLTTPIPPTGTSLTHFEVSIGKVKIGQEEGQADLLRHGPVQEEEVDRHGDGELLRRLEQKLDIGPEVQGEEEVGDSLS